MRVHAFVYVCMFVCICACVMERSPNTHVIHTQGVYMMELVHSHANGLHYSVQSYGTTEIQLQKYCMVPNLCCLYSATTVCECGQCISYTSNRLGSKIFKPILPSLLFRSLFTVYMYFRSIHYAIGSAVLSLRVLRMYTYKQARTLRQ